MSPQKTFLAVVAVLVFGSLLAAWLVLTFHKPQPPSPQVRVSLDDSTEVCTLACTNRSGKEVESVDVRYVVPAVLSYLKVGGGHLVSLNTSPEGGQVKISAKLLDGERLECMRLAGSGTIKSIVITIGGKATEHKLEMSFVQGKTLDLQLEPDGKLTPVGPPVAQTGKAP